MEKLCRTCDGSGYLKDEDESDDGLLVEQEAEYRRMV